MNITRRLSAFLLLPTILSAAFTVAIAQPQTPKFKTRVLVITGGHGFEEAPFFKLFEENPNITFQATTHTNVQALHNLESAKDFDVLVMYDFNQSISEEAKADFLGLLRAGKGLVILHHAIAAYPKWPEYWKIVGAHYYLEKTTVDGVEKARTQWKHDGHYKVHIADPAHPVTQGVSDFDIHDETYKGYDVYPDCHPLLTTDSPENNSVFAWANTYENSRIVYIQCGHDHFAYENPNYQRILQQAIQWTGKQSRAREQAAQGAHKNGTALTYQSRKDSHFVSQVPEWKSLFDGKTTAGWHSFHKTTFPERGWVAEDGWLHCLGQHGGDIVSDELFDQFDVLWEWKIARGGNSGLKYFVLDSRKSAIGHEYQMLDDERNPDGKLADGKRLTASFYDVLKPMVKTSVREPGEINHSRVLVRGNHVEHWLNGVKVLEYEAGSDAVKEAVAQSKFKDMPGFGERAKGHILLQDHNSDVWFRNIRIRDLSGG
ncbi:MAG: hypothetical protein C5B50_14170 [Verrucomicrobia bacterium]|nr:MAG: hypothetical protein C5B50_14170 [Verrucomicrobiota bacterium]